MLFTLAITYRTEYILFCHSSLQLNLHIVIKSYDAMEFKIKLTIHFHPLY